MRLFSKVVIIAKLPFLLAIFAKNDNCASVIYISENSAAVASTSVPAG
jgi:hypothetical protein